MEDLGVPLFQETSKCGWSFNESFERKHQPGDLQEAMFSSDQIGGLGLSRAYFILITLW